MADACASTYYGHRCGLPAGHSGLHRSGSDAPAWSTDVEDKTEKLADVALDLVRHLSDLIGLAEMDAEAEEPGTDLYAVIEQSREAIAKATGRVP